MLNGKFESGIEFIADQTFCVTQGSSVGHFSKVFLDSLRDMNGAGRFAAVGSSDRFSLMYEEHMSRVAAAQERREKFERRRTEYHEHVQENLKLGNAKYPLRNFKRWTDADLTAKVAEIAKMQPLDAVTHCFKYGYIVPRKYGELHQKYRELQQKMASGTYAHPVWYRESWYRNSPLIDTLLAHVSEVDKMQIAYSQSADKILAGVTTRMKPGKFLQKYFSDVLDEKQIKYWAEKHSLQYSPKVMHIATTSEDIVSVINFGPSESCMSSGFHHTEVWYSGHVHPATVYDERDINVAYITSDNMPVNVEACRSGKQKVVGRCLFNVSTKMGARPYGDRDKMVEAMRKADLDIDEGALIGCRLKKIKNKGGRGHIMAYVDAGTASGGGSLYYEDQGSYWMLTESDGDDTYIGYQKKGTTGEGEYWTCACCEEEFDIDDDDYSYDYNENRICSSCADNDYVSAWYRGDTYLCHLSDFIEVGSEYYVNTSRNRDYYDIIECDHCDCYVLGDDACETEGGNTVCSDCYVTDEVTGRGCHVGEVVSSYDGTIFEDDSVQCAVLRKTCHIRNCYELSHSGITYYVHMSQVEDKANLHLFVRIGDSLALRSKCPDGVEITEWFEADNVDDGANTEFAGDDVVSAWLEEPSSSTEEPNSTVVVPSASDEANLVVPSASDEANLVVQQMREAA